MMIITYGILYFIVFLYHVYTGIGIVLFSSHAFTFGKKIKSFSNMKIDYELLLNKFMNNKFSYNNSLYKKYKKTLVIPETKFFNLKNSIYKFRIVIIQNFDNTYNVDVYYDVISKYCTFLFLYFMPFVFSFGLIETFEQVRELMPYRILLYFIIFFSINSLT